MLETTLNYMAPMAARPFYLQYEPPPGTPWRNVKADRHTVVVHDARGEEAPSLDAGGFLLASLQTEARDLHDESQIQSVYYRECEELVRQVTGARRVVAFDHNLRRGKRRELILGADRHDLDLAKDPVRFPHNDYTVKSGPQRVRDLLPAEAEDLLTRRFAVINVWKPIRGPVEEAPLAVCDARSIRPEDLVETDLVYKDRRGEVYSMLYAEAHRWSYYPAMRAGEAMLLKCYDSDPGRARFTAHSAFDDPTSKPYAAPRESIEVRTLAFFDEARKT